MKVDLVRKFKWYIIGFILVAIMLSVSLSFCAWDTLSIKAILSAKSGAYNDMVVLAEDRYLSDGVTAGSNGRADVGDIVTFGRYYQDLTESGDIAEKTPIRWIVVEKDNNMLTLLAEKVMAFGSFWGSYYHNGSSWVYGENSSYYQNYSKSTLRAWLNSYYTGEDARKDAGEAFSAGNTQPRFRGFMSEAFTSAEQSFILPKQMSGLKGYPKNDITNRDEEYAAVTDKVWVPSWSEVYGTTLAYYPEWITPIDNNWNTYDGSPNARFSYFNGAIYNQANPILEGQTTAYASSRYSNYTIESATFVPNYQSSVTGSNVWWWLRSPNPSSFASALAVHAGGNGDRENTDHSFGGVRPAVYVQL